MQNSISEIIADFAINLSFEDIPDEVIAHGKKMLIDTFGVSIASYNLDHARMIKNVLIASKTQKESTLWGTYEKVQVSDAVIYNSSLIHGMDYDDTHVGSIVHPSASIVSTALAVGELVDANGKEVLEAIVAGWEVIIRLGLAAKGKFHDIGYHATGILSSFASVCTAAKLMKAPREVLVNALGICGSQSAALQQFLQDGSWVKKIHPGWAAHSAIYALKLAHEGLVGPKQVFEGKYGLWNTHLRTTEGLNEGFSDIGLKWNITDVTFKMYPVCHFTHSFIDCILDIKKENDLKEQDIKKIICKIDDRGYKIVCEPMSAKIRPETDYMMRFSLPYLVSIALINGRISPSEINIKYAKSPEVQALMDKVDCIQDVEMSRPGYFPGWVEIVTEDGRRFQKEQLYDQGTIQNPNLYSRIISKFKDNTELFISEERASRLVNIIEKFEDLGNMHGLISMLKPDTGSQAFAES